MALEWTGERLVTDNTLGKGVAEHLHRYALTLKYVKGKNVLDIASGEGYGSKLIAGTAQKVIGVDVSEDAIQHARSFYEQDNLDFICGSVVNIPVETGSVDVVVSFETIEHVEDQLTMLQEIKRVLKKDGLLIISSPERENYRKVDPDNPYHVKELSGEEFRELLSKYFNHFQVFSQSFHIASIVTPLSGAIQQKEFLSGNFSSVNHGQENSITLYNIAFCSNVELPEKLPGLSIFNGEEMFKNHLSALAETYCNERIERFRNSASYRVGNILIKPFSWLKNRLKS